MTMPEAVPVGQRSWCRSSRYHTDFSAEASALIQGGNGSMKDIRSTVRWAKAPVRDQRSPTSRRCRLEKSVVGTWGCPKGRRAPSPASGRRWERWSADAFIRKTARRGSVHVDKRRPRFFSPVRTPRGLGAAVLCRFFAEDGLAAEGRKRRRTDGRRTLLCASCVTWLPGPAAK